MVGLYRKLLGHPFVYNEIRPRVVGGIDMRRLYALLDGAAGRRVLDIGCGTGDALRYLDGFEEYLGVDTDEVAIEAARARWKDRRGVRFETRTVTPEDVRELAPTGVVLSGVLHHVSNDDGEGVLRLAAASPSLVRIATSDIVFLPGQFLNNVFAMMDRGRYCRDPDAYVGLARRAGLRLEQAFTMQSSPANDRVHYFIMSLAPGEGRA